MERISLHFVQIESKVDIWIPIERECANGLSLVLHKPSQRFPVSGLADSNWSGAPGDEKASTVQSRRLLCEFSQASAGRKAVRNRCLPEEFGLLYTARTSTRLLIEPLEGEDR
jgi:hypothetical protein